jgi:hypothetical protein
MAGGETPPDGFEEHFFADLDTHPYVIENDLDVPRPGLDAFLDYAQDMRERAEVAGRPRVGRTFADLARETPAEIAWLVPGLIAPGWDDQDRSKGEDGQGNTLLLPDRQAGTWGAARLRSVAAGDGSCRDGGAGGVVREKAEAFGLERSLVVYGFELAGLTWEQQVEQIVALARDEGHGVIYGDNFSRRAGVEDENGVELGRALELIADPCRARGIALIVDHHHKKGPGRRITS